MKAQRHARILELVSKHEIETQEDMMSRLQAEGFKVTQATVSRDLKELKLTKTLTARGTYRYSVNHGRQHAGSGKLNNAMVDSIVQVDYSLNTVVIKTYPGLAQAVAARIDALDISDIIGCVAGDDAILVVTRGEEATSLLTSTLPNVI